MRRPQIALVPPSRVQIHGLQGDLVLGSTGLLARKSRPLAETILQHVWCARKVVAGKLPATPKAFGACAPQNCAPRDFSRHHRKRCVLLPPRKKTAPELIPERLPSDPTHITTCFVFRCTLGFDFSRSSGVGDLFFREIEPSKLRLSDVCASYGKISFLYSMARHRDRRSRRLG